MSAPWMPLYVADYLADTAHLCASEHGAYLLLIMHYWRAGKLPADERQLQRIARMTTREWANSRDTLAALFSDGWTHKRIENELAKSDLKSTARAESGSRGGKAKALKNNDASLANATILPQQKDDFALASSSHSQPEKKEDPSSLRSDGAQREKPAARKSRFPSDFCPNDAGIATATAAGITGGELRDQLLWFADHHTAKGSLMVDWQAAWRTWCGNYRSFGRARAGPSNNPRPRTAHDAIAEELRKYENAKPDHDHFGGITIDASPG